MTAGPSTGLLRTAVPVVGYAGSLFPMELALATGCALRSLDPAPSPGDHPLVEQWIDDKEGEWVRGMVATAIMESDGHPGLDAIVVTRAFEQAYYYLRELQRLGAADLPTLHMFDLIQSKGESFALYNRRQIQDLLDLLARLTHRQPTSAELCEAIDIVNARRARQQSLAALRLSGALSGAAAADYILGGCEGDVPNERRANGSTDRSLLIVTSETLADSRLHAAVEEAGFRVIAEDDGSGRFVPAEPIDAGDDPIGAISRHYSAVPTSRSQMQNMRFAYVRSVLARGVDALLCQVAAHDQLFGWDVPTLRREAEQAGTAFALVHGDSIDEAVAALRVAA